MIDMLFIVLTHIINKVLINAKIKIGMGKKEKIMSNDRHATMIYVGGWMLVLFSILFVGLTIVIDNLVQAQQGLYSLEQHKLFKVASGSEAIRFLLIMYGLIPMLLIPGAVAMFYSFINVHEANMRVGMYFATAGALALSISLLMLPSINWHLVSYIPSLSGTDQAMMIILLQALHTYLGIYIGDILGLGSLLVWFFITSFVMLRDPAMPHVVGVIQIIISICAALVLLLRYLGVGPDFLSSIQAPGIMALWIFISGISLISLRK